ncbi:uncharacterized protein I206_105572 [Kwoniella pini CBS 10737]|uniref:Uncharacterized protein n=1 Tax=Kwoniella pini CBS 10737 TaxID=1296096 RepID=A0A1B9I3V9_9TREE|nr:uncharacterized protein I206_03525 [Kwoniella pini CBS 10737]OCF50206.1 hypothetical protein I206_03525 [Kwoniella pini CBS 10737]
MPPRLPSRQCVELVQLGFLIPWAGKRSTHTPTSTSTSTNATGPTSPTEQHAESSKMALQRRQGLSTEYPSIIHQYLSSPNPPSPSSLLLMLRSRHQHLTLSAGQALSVYCVRMGDLKSYRRVWKLMSENRVAPIAMVLNNMAKKFPHRSKVIDTDSVSKSTKFGNSFDVLRHFVSEKYKFRPNRWAVKMFPPTSTISRMRYRKVELLNHLHYLILQGESPTFKESISLFRESIDYRDSENLYENINFLNLHLAYLHRLPEQDSEKIDGLDLVEIYQKEFPSAKLNKQTLHLLIKSLMQSQNQENKILACLSYFIRDHNIIPGPETFRILARYSTYLRSDELAHVAWQGWIESMKQLNKSQPFQKRKFNFPVDNVKETTIDVQQEIPRIRFHRFGNMNKRWTGIIDLYKGVGWITQHEYELEHYSELDGLDIEKSYKWLGEKGRLDMEARTQMDRDIQVEKEKKSIIEEGINVDNAVLHANEGFVNISDLDQEMRKEAALQSTLDQTITPETLLSTSNIVTELDLSGILQNSPEDIPAHTDSNASIDETQSMSNIPDTPNTHDIHQTPYFVIIRDGSTIKIRSKAEQDQKQLEFEDHLNGLSIDDKPIWE